MAGAEAGAAHMQGASTCVEQNTERVGRSGQSQRQCRPQHPFHSDDGMGMEPDTAPHQPGLSDL